MRIKHILYLALIGFSILPLLLFLIHIIGSIDSYASESFLTRMKETVTVQAEAIEEHFDNLEDILLDLLTMEDVHALLNGEIAPEEDSTLLAASLLRAQMRCAQIDSLTWLTDEGDFLASTGDGTPDQLLKEEIRNAIMADREGLQSFIGVFHKGVSDKNPSCHLFFLNSLGADKGYLLMAVQTKEIISILNNSRFSENGYSFLVSETQQIYEQPFTYIQTVTSNSKYAQMLETDFFASNDLLFSYNDGMWDYDAFTRQIGDSKWAVIGSARRSEVRAGLANLKNRILVFTIGLLIITLFLGITVISRKMKPLDQLILTLERINRGDYEWRLDASQKNEFGEIASSFNNLVEDIIISDSRYRNIVEMSDNIIFEWNIQKDTVFVSSSFNRKFTYRAPTDRFVDSFLKKWNVYFEDRRKYTEDIKVLERGDAFIENEYRVKDMYGGYIWMRMRAASLTDKEGKPLKAVGVLTDIDRGKRSELLLRERASYDALTELFNRGTFERMLAEEVEVTIRRGKIGGLFFVDVDNFKYYNDGFSHSVGDEVLRFIASCVRRMVEETGFAGRYGGDEFVAFARVPSKDARETFATMAQSLQERLKAGYYSVVAECQLSVSASTGIVLLDDGCEKYEDVIRAADSAMYRIKENGKGSYGFLNE